MLIRSLSFFFFFSESIIFMASPIDTFKNNLFGQLKTYGDAVQGAFEQRIGKLFIEREFVLGSLLLLFFFLARPLLAFKRDLSRSSSTSRTSSDREPEPQTTFISYEQSILASSSPLEIIDIETPDPLKTLLDKFKNAFSSSTPRQTTEECNITNEISQPLPPASQQHHSSISTSLSKKTRRQQQFRHKSVSFAEHSPTEEQSSSIIQQSNEIIPSINNNSSIISIDDDNSEDFERHFQQIIRPRRRISLSHPDDLLYQDIAAEIVAYVLKHALRAVEQEQEELIDLK